MLPDAATAAKHPAVAEFVIEQLQASNAALQASLRALLARPEPLAPEALRSALAQQPQALQHCADAI